VVDKSLVGVFFSNGQTIDDKNGNSITVDADFFGKSFKKPVDGPLSNLTEGNNFITWYLKR
jgi:hypothetical protein